MYLCAKCKYFLLNFIRLIIKMYSHKTPPQVTIDENLINVSRCLKTQDECKTKCMT